MLALDDYESTLCPRCGLPASICHDPLTPTRMGAEVDVCQVALLREVAVEEWKKDHAHESDAKLAALTTGVTAR